MSAKIKPGPLRSLPSDQDAERQIIEGALVPGGVEKAIAVVCSEDFSTIGGKKIFAALEALHQTGRPISVTVLETFLQADPDFSRILAVLDSMAPFTAEGVTHFSKIVRELSIRRQLMHLAAGVVDDLGDVSISIPKAVATFVRVCGEAKTFLNGGGHG